MSFSLWLEKGWLKEHKPTSREIAEQEAQEMVELAKQIRQQVEAWIRNNHSELAREI